MDRLGLIDGACLKQEEELRKPYRFSYNRDEFCPITGARSTGAPWVREEGWGGPKSEKVQTVVYHSELPAVDNWGPDMNHDCC